MSGSSQAHWKHSWPSAEVLGEFMACNSELFKNKVVLELGSGATGICGLTAAKLGAKKVWMSDHPDLTEALDILKQNTIQNEVDEVCQIVGLNWDERQSLTDVINQIGDQLDIVLASDVFFDPSTFRGLVDTFEQILERYQHATIYSAYQQRNDNWSLEAFLKSSVIDSTLIRKSIHQNKGAIHTIELGIFNRKMSGLRLAGIEGGATCSKLVIIDEHGNKIWSDSHGTNYYLQGVETVGNHIAQWIRRVAVENNIKLPLDGLGMGLSGAEDATINQNFVDYLNSRHGDIARFIHLDSDAVCTVAANFEDQGIVLIAGTGSSCRMVTKNGEIRGVGGWGHSVGDGGSGYWIANRAIRALFDHDDGLEECEYSVEKVRELLCNHFKIDDKVGILDYLYQKFEKQTVAEFTKVMSEHASDPLITKMFYDGGYILGRHIKAITRNLSDEDKKTIRIVLVGSVFKSWDLLKKGFIAALESSGISTLELYEPSEHPAIGAAVLIARKMNTKIEHANNKRIKDTIHL